MPKRALGSNCDHYVRETVMDVMMPRDPEEFVAYALRARSKVITIQPLITVIPSASIEDKLSGTYIYYLLYAALTPAGTSIMLCRPVIERKPTAEERLKRHAKSDEIKSYLIGEKEVQKIWEYLAEYVPDVTVHLLDRKGRPMNEAELAKLHLEAEKHEVTV